MKFILEIRPLAENDLSPSAPFLPELYIETEESLGQDELKKRIKPMFTETIMQNLRFVSLAKLQLEK